MMTEAQVRELVRAERDRAGSMRALAKELGVSVSYVCDVLNGRRAPGPPFLAMLGLEKATGYRKAEPSPPAPAPR